MHWRRARVKLRRPFAGGVEDMKCPMCKRSHLVEIEVMLGDQRVTMHSCSRCDSRWWDKDGERVELPRVTELASRN